jgi:soluble lytic murein transglycosylase-like protein
MDLIPATVAERMIALSRREGLWRGALIGFVGGCAFTFLILFSVPVGAQEIPREASEHRRDLIRSARSVWGMNAPTASLAAQVHQESLWRADARSWVGAAGLTQFMPSTVDWIRGVYPEELADGDPYDPKWALRAQSRYMLHLWERVRGLDECERFAFAASAYNGGLGWVNKRKALSPTPSICLGATCDINPGIRASAQRENQEYSRRILLTLEPVYVAYGWGRGVCTRRSE